VTTVRFLEIEEAILGPILLKEYEDQSVSLAEADAEFISKYLVGKISINRDFRGTKFVLNAGQHVGVIVLPSERRIEIRPKIPVTNLFYMLAVAFHLPTFRAEIAKSERLDDIFEFIANVFAGFVEERVNAGLYRWYIEERENLAHLRGRIEFAEDSRQNHILRQRTYCRFDEFSWDIPENQVIRQVCHLLSGWNFTPKTCQRLAQIDAELAEITRSRFSAGDVGKFQYHRLNEDYRDLHQLCRLFLDAASVSEDVGAFRFRAFLVDMNKLFEDFVCAVLTSEHPGI
jgi:5-methylcytosine-specific restriction enzyme subunit McrC